MVRFCKRFVFCLSLFCALSAVAQKDVVNEVNPLIGTGSGPIGYGGTMPFVTAPFGMTNWTPQTRQNRLSVTSYEYSDKTIQGFMGTHQAAIWMGDFGYVTLMPEIGALKTTPEARALAYDHAHETTHPDFYSVDMKTQDGKTIHAEMTATERCAYLRFTFPAGVEPRILLEASRPKIDGKVSITNGEITGQNPHRIDNNLGPFALPNFSGYFVAQFHQHTTGGDTYGLNTAAAHGASVTFAKTTAPTVIEMRIGTSFLSIDQARENIAKEIPTWNFATTRQKLHATWQQKLGNLTIAGATQDERTTAYTALYHALLYPRVFSEYGRYYSAFDDTVHNGSSYTDYSTWDTFRAEHSLLTLVAPERIDGMITALLQDYKEGGWMPKWPNPSYTNIMIGTHADSMVAEAIRKGFHGFDRELAWKAVYKDAMSPPDGDTTRRWLDREEHTPYEARAGLTYYKQLGFIPTDKTDEATSRTLEDSYDDWCVAQVAKAVGRMDDYRFFLKRSLNDRNLFDKTNNLMRGKTSDGKWAPLGGSKDTNGNRSVSGWTEGDAWVYTWSPFHDIAGVERLMGGAEIASKQIDQHFAGNHNVHKNEPSHHYGYLYDFTGQPWKTQARVREIAYKEYANQPAGLDGDDDCGQMSAWYLFTALGMYPVNPASGDYMIGSPMYGRMSLKLANGKTFTVIADNNSRSNVYIQSATLNVKPLDKPVITWKQIQSGTTLHVIMGAKPSRWASAWRPSFPEDAL
ncbi:GH92 family glycosyl hydrolase [Terriglobus sp. RCC_193]|uniref:GH92 family glycosyl hydrolase n=1 Tax=Terriglobus sp. RCC_193 TaxID=3239218 RepID=UPI0035261703